MALVFAQAQMSVSLVPTTVFSTVFALQQTASGDQQNLMDQFQSSYAHYRFDLANLESAVFHGLRLDLSDATVSHDIANVSQDGARHDPCLNFDSVRPLCASSSVQDSQHGAPRVWRSRMAGDKFLRPDIQLTRSARESDKVIRACGAPTAADVPSYTFSDDVRVLLIARKDDHNPFFQLSTTFNAWIMMKMLRWSNLDTQIMYLDKGIPSAVDELCRGLLAPSRPSLSSAELALLQTTEAKSRGVVEFGTVLIAPFEDMGPMMRHLENPEPCRQSLLMIDFRSESLASMGVKNEKRSEKCTLTIISRRNYEGRNLQRIWHNEQEVLDRMIADFGDRCTMQTIDIVGVTMAEQMQTIVNSDIIAGMHRAGMANVMWTRPETLVIEIFPKPRRRWGFRNICQHVGCEWHEFRGGQDIPSKTSKRKNGRPDPSALDKSIPPDEWIAFANPLIEVAITRSLSQ